MDPKKLQFAEDVLRLIRRLCKLTFNKVSNEEIEAMFGVPIEQLKQTIGKIAEGLPDFLFDQAYKKTLEEIKPICAREFIFFRIQEQPDDPYFETKLDNFIRILSRDIQRKK